MRDAIKAAHGRQYSVKGAVGLYPTSGTSDDYAYSRSFVDAHKGKVLGYTIEWGPQRASIPKSFHPDYPDMVPDHRGGHRRAARLLLGAGGQARHTGSGPRGGTRRLGRVL